MTSEASRINQLTFEFLFPRLHQAIAARIAVLMGEEYLKKCNELILSFQCQDPLIQSVSYRIKSTHSIWKKIPSLEALEKMNQKEFADCVNDFIGIRWEMKILKSENRYDALMNGVRLAPLKNILSFRNQQLPQKNGFGSEPVMKFYYSIDGLPVELQLLGGSISSYMCAKGYSEYKTQLSLSPKIDPDRQARRLQMAAELEGQAAFRKNMMAELLENTPSYSEYDPFVLDEMPLGENHRKFRFSHDSKPACEISNLVFDGNAQFE